MTDIDKIATRIRKLLAMADEASGATDNEREIALRRANALMDQHSISAVELGDDTDDAGERGQSAIEVGASPWRRTVISALASLYGCSGYYWSGAGGRHFVIGREQHRAVVISMARYVIANIEREGKAVSAERAKWDYRVRSYMNSWRKGAASGVWATVHRLKAERERGDTVEQPGTALVLVSYYAAELTANKAWRDDNVPGLGRGRSTTYSDRNAYRSGRTYGAGISLSGQIGGSAQRRIR